jgi:ferric-dicitrate binding protein FerR (iron transport regulator)
MDKVQARLIAEKFASGICTAEEHDALFAWLISLPLPESSVLMEEFSGIFETLQAVPGRQDLWNKIYEKLDEPRLENTERPSVFRLPVAAPAWRKWMFAAAASVLIFLTGSIFFFTGKKTPPSVMLQPTHDVAPGGNKATLTLANGTVIVLDSIRDGQLAVQGNTKVVKLNNSSLVYQTGAQASDSIAVAYNTITTPKGGQYQLILPDGSTVWLNSASSLKFPTVFRGKNRQVELSGEGYFEIEKNIDMPFTVSVNHMQVKVLGTRFDIMAYADEKTVNTTLLQGAVEVEQGTLGKQLAPGEQAVLDGPGNKLDVVRADIQKVMAWKNGVFEFDNTDMATIMRQLSRWYDIDVQYKVKPDMAELGGSISKKLNLSQVLNLLETNGINHFIIEGKKVTVLP